MGQRLGLLQSVSDGSHLLELPSDGRALPRCRFKQYLRFEPAAAAVNVVEPPDHVADRDGLPIVAGRSGMRDQILESQRFAAFEFLDECIVRGLRCVRIVHGKGLGSGDRGPILKNKVCKWLKRHPAILAFCSAQRRHGGTGAVYALLRK